MVSWNENEDTVLTLNQEKYNNKTKYFRGPWVSQKLLQWLVSHELTAYLSVFDLFFTKWIMAILSNGCKPDNFESYNSLQLNVTNIWGLCLNFVECESFLEWNSPDVLALCETNLDDLTDSGNFSVTGIFL